MPGDGSTTPEPEGRRDASGTNAPTHERRPSPRGQPSSPFISSNDLSEELEHLTCQLGTLCALVPGPDGHPELAADPRFARANTAILVASEAASRALASDAGGRADALREARTAIADAERAVEEMRSLIARRSPRGS